MCCVQAYLHQEMQCSTTVTLQENTISRSDSSCWLFRLAEYQDENSNCTMILGRTEPSVGRKRMENQALSPL